MNVHRGPFGGRFLDPLTKKILTIDKNSQKKVFEYKKKKLPASEILQRRSQHLDNAFIKLALKNIEITDKRVGLRIQGITADIHKESGPNYPWKPGEFKAKVIAAIKRGKLMKSEKADEFSEQMGRIALLHDALVNGKD